MTDAATRVAGGKAESIIGGAAIAGDFIQTQLPEHADKWNTIVETALASPFFSAGFTAAGDGIQSGVDALGKKNITARFEKTEKGLVCSCLIGDIESKRSCTTSALETVGRYFYSESRKQEKLKIGKTAGGEVSLLDYDELYQEIKNQYIV